MRSAADNVWMMYPPADDVPTCGRCADNVRMTSGQHMSSASQNLA